jgi:hypothetical protein
VPLDRKIINLFSVMLFIIVLVTGYAILYEEIRNNDENLENTPPTAPIVLISPSPAYCDSNLTCIIVIPSIDAENDTITYSYEWKRNGTPTDLETATVPTANTVCGEIWQCFVTPFDGKEYGDVGSDTIRIQIQEHTEPENTPPSAPEVTIVPNPAYSNNTLMCTITSPSMDAENDSITYSYDWLRNQTATGFTGTNLSSIHTKTGEEWTCIVTPYDGKEYGPTGNASIIISDDGIPIPNNNPPTAPEVNIEPESAYSNSTLTCTILVTSTDLDNDSISYIYEWYQNGNLTNETGNTITANKTQVGDEWKCVVTPFDGIEYGSSGNDTIRIQVEASGTYSLNPQISFTCAYGMVTLSYTSFTFIDTGTILTVQPLMNNGGYMTGATASYGNIDVTFDYPGLCTEIYTLSGSFTDENTWEAIFRVYFTGQCLDCYTIQWTVVGTRV